MTYVIAEIGGNHDGSFYKAIDLIQQAAECGVDGVKFQTYRADKLVHHDEIALPQAQKLGYQSQYERFKDLEFTHTQWMELANICKMCGVDFLTTCFDIELLRRFAPHMPAIKIASGDLTYHDLIREAASFGKPVWLSTGGATFSEIREASKWVPRDLLTVLHCVSSYPTPDNDANLAVIRSLKDHFKHIGYSDHTIGNTACLAAVAMGAEVVEKHFTDNNVSDYGDHPLSANPHEMKQLVTQIRRLETMLGNDKPARCEKETIKKLRRGAYAVNHIEKGQHIQREDIEFIRPSNGIDINLIIGVPAMQDYSPGDAVNG